MNLDVSEKKSLKKILSPLQTKAQALTFWLVFLASNFALKFVYLIISGFFIVEWYDTVFDSDL